MKIFGYGRVSTDRQTTDNQRLELEQAGYKIDYWYQDEGVSGKVPASKRPAFAELLTKIREDETLIVAKLDRLGRDAIDILETIRGLELRSIRVIVHQLGNSDLTSPAGRLLVTMLAAVAEMERDIIRERINAGLARAKSVGKKLGRRPKLASADRATIKDRIAAGAAISSLAREFSVSRATILTCK